jgi:cytochrome c biogenesis protein CcmG/thiol:disulfide interchange protein DsbE
MVLKYRGLHPAQKLFIILGSILIVLVYAIYQNKEISRWQVAETDLILKTLPSFSFEEYAKKKTVNEKNIFDENTTGLFVHLWGTWCPPCEAEFPSFVELARKLEKFNVKFLLIAVNDSELKVKKYMSRYKDLPQNIVLVLDPEQISLGILGTLKVPETYLFDSKGKHLNKYIGPQEWRRPFYFDDVKRLLNLRTIY